MRDEAVKTFGYLYGVMYNVYPDKFSARGMLDVAQVYPAYGYSLAMRLILIGHRMTPALERVISDAMQTLDIEDMDEPKKMITDKQQIMWDLAFEHGRAAKISSDGEYLADKMREKGLILEDVGNACGVSKSCVGNWVQDLRPIPRKHKETIATTFSILL